MLILKNTLIIHFLTMFTGRTAMFVVTTKKNALAQRFLTFVCGRPNTSQKNTISNAHLQI